MNKQKQHQSNMSSENKNIGDSNAKSAKIGGGFIHPKVKEAEDELSKRKMFLKQVDTDLERSKQELEVL